MDIRATTTTTITTTVEMFFCDMLCQRDVVEQMSQTKTDTIQKMLDQVIREYEVSSTVF